MSECDCKYTGTRGNWGNLIKYNTLQDRWPGAKREDIIDLIFEKETEVPRLDARGKLYFNKVRKQPRLLLFWCHSQWEDGESSLSPLSNEERENVARMAISKVDDRIVVLEHDDNSPFDGVLDIENEHPEYASLVVKIDDLSCLDKTQQLNQIRKWESILQKLHGAEFKAAKIAIEKWRTGGTHEQCFHAAFPDGEDRNAKDYVSKARRTAQLIVERHADHGLEMPPWQSVPSSSSGGR